MRSWRDKLLPPGAIAIALLLAPGTATAGCFIEVTPLQFGAYDVFDPSPVDSTARLTVRCDDPGIAVAIGADSGGSPSFHPRRMSCDGHALAYNLFVDAAASRVLGDGTQNTVLLRPPTPPSPRGVSLAVFGRIPARQSVPAGVYRDTITLKIRF